MKRIGVILILFLAFFGLADSIYLAQQAESGAPLICNIQSLSGCNTVAASEYSKLFGIPIAEYGVLFYGIVFVLAVLELFVMDRRVRRALQAFALLGVVLSLYFTLLQAFVIKAFCIYCLASAVIAVLILLSAGLIEPVRPKRNSTPAAVPPTHLPMPPAP